MFGAVGGIVGQNVLKQVALEIGVILIERVGDLVLVGEAGRLDLLGEVFLDILVGQANPQSLEILKGQVEQIELLEVNGVVDVEAQLLKVGNDDVGGFLVPVLLDKLIAKSVEKGTKNWVGFVFCRKNCVCLRQN